MKKILVLLLAITFFPGLKAQDAIKLESSKDSISYATGVSMFYGTQKIPVELDYDILIKAFLEAKDDQAFLTESDANLYISTILRNQDKIARKENYENGKRFLEENRKVEGIIETESGLQYRVIRMGEGQKPTIEDRVRVHYTGYLLDGTKFDSSIDRGEPAEFGLTSVIKGWTEALQLMPVGSEFVVYIPSELAYGDRQAGQIILPGSTLMFEIQLIGIVE